MNLNDLDSQILKRLEILINLINHISDPIMGNLKDKEERKEIKPTDEGIEDDSSVLNVDGANSASRNMGGDISPPKTQTMEHIPKKDNTEKKRLTAADRKKLTEQKRKEKEDKKKRRSLNVQQTKNRTRH